MGKDFQQAHAFSADDDLEVTSIDVGQWDRVAQHSFGFPGVERCL